MRRVESERQIIQLTREQEEELVADTKLLLVAISVSEPGELYRHSCHLHRTPRPN